jgi:hypothetical protein
MDYLCMLGGYSLRGIERLRVGVAYEHPGYDVR